MFPRTSWTKSPTCPKTAASDADFGFTRYRSRKLFETRAQIRAEALRKGIHKARVKENKRLRSLLKKHRIEIPPEVAEEIFNVPSDT